MRWKVNKEDLVNIVKNFVREKYNDAGGSHDWWHIKRVYNNAMLINESEKADEYILKIIVLMHDLYDYKYFDGNAEEKLKETLLDFKADKYFSESEIQNIIYSCINLGFSKNIKEKKELSHEGKIAQDADRLDAIGAIGIARTFTYGGEKGKEIYNPGCNMGENTMENSDTTINHFYNKLLKLKDLMNTNTAKKIAIERHKFLE